MEDFEKERFYSPPSSYWVPRFVFQPGWHSTTLPYHNQLESILVHHNQVPLMLCFLVEEALLRKIIRNQLRPSFYKTKTEKKEKKAHAETKYTEQYKEWKHRDYVIACSAPKCPETMYDCQILQIWNIFYN